MEHKMTTQNVTMIRPELDQETLADLESEASERAFDARLINLFRSEFPADWFASTGEVILSLQSHVELMLTRYGTWPTAEQRDAQAALTSVMG
jgi:hypothetical protein